MSGAAVHGTLLCPRIMAIDVPDFDSRRTSRSARGFFSDAYMTKTVAQWADLDFQFPTTRIRRTCLDSFSTAMGNAQSLRIPPSSGFSVATARGSSPRQVMKWADLVTLTTSVAHRVRGAKAR
jgi:hypothetical protein